MSNVTENSMKNWNVKSTSVGETLGEVKIEASVKETLYHQSCLSSLWYPLILYCFDTILLRDMKAGYMSGESRGELITYSLSMI